MFSNDEIELNDDELETLNNNSDRVKRSVHDLFGANNTREFNPSVDLSSTLYCSIVNKIPLKCMQFNILDIFTANIFNLTKDDVVDGVRNYNR